MRRLLLAALLVAALAAASGATTASPQPEPVCTVCDHPRIDDDAVGATAVTVDVREDGDAAWRIRVDIENESRADDLRERPPDLSSSPGTALVDAEVVDPTVTVTDDDALVVTFVHENAARSAFGDTLLVEYLRDGAMYTDVNVDRFEIRGPDGYVVANDPADATVDGRTAAWTERNWLDGSFVVFAHEDAAAADLRAAVAIGLAHAPVVTGNLPYVLLPAALLGLLLGGSAAVVALLVESRPRSLAAVGAVATVPGALAAATLLGGGLNFPAAWPLAVSFPLVGVAAARFGRKRTALVIATVTALFAVALARWIGAAAPVHGLALVAAVVVAVAIAAIAAPLVIAGALAERRRSERD